MPLPAALAARLAQRGILQGKKTANSKKEPKKKIHEEVIAEDYDNAKEEINTIDIAQKFMGYSGCPNKYNIYHECSKKCKELWGKGHTQPSERYLKRQMKLLKKYPLPDNWKAIYDPGSGRHYYWDWSSDLVAWLPPDHPKCQISQPASQLREELHLKATEQDDNTSSEESGSEHEPEEVEEPEPKRDKKDIKERDNRDNRNRERDNRDNRERDRDRERERDRDRERERERDRDRDRERHRPNDSRPRHYKPDKFKDGKDGKKDRTLDPMDPASYSDIPRGKWSDGLPVHNEAKTGVDTTVSGPLYQMRPYPSPGAVLRSNKANNKEEKDEEPSKQKVSGPEEPEEQMDDE